MTLSIQWVKKFSYECLHGRKYYGLGKKGKLIPHLIEYEATEKVELVPYQLALPTELQKMHDVFQVSMLRRYQSNPSHVISIEEIEIQLDLTYDEEPVKILAREVKELRNK